MSPRCLSCGGVKSNWWQGWWVVLTGEQRARGVWFACELCRPLFNSCLSINKGFTRQGEATRCKCVCCVDAGGCVRAGANSRAAHFSWDDDYRGTVKTLVTDERLMSLSSKGPWGKEQESLDEETLQQHRKDGEVTLISLSCRKLLLHWKLWL